MAQEGIVKFGYFWKINSWNVENEIIVARQQPYRWL
jgi:hypothetical protein